MAHHQSPGPISEPQYETVTSFSRCLHYPDYRLCFDNKRMMPRRIKMNRYSSLSAVDQVLWFEPSLSSLDQHNWYGNATFIIGLDELIQRFGPNFYYIDKQEFETHTASRVVLSKKSPTLTKVDLNLEGSPIKKVYSRWFGAMTCKSSIYDKMVPHKLEVAIEVDPEDCEWIYKRAKVEPNNHDLANTKIGFGSRTCHRENTFGRTCSFAVSREEMRKKLEEECPDYNNA